MNTICMNEKTQPVCIEVHDRPDELFGEDKLTHQAPLARDSGSDASRQNRDSGQGGSPASSTGQA